jgi:hypothetical protein
VSWRVSRKEQSARTVFKVPATDAPNVAGARALIMVRGHAGQGDDDLEAPDLSRLKADVERGALSALYVFDPGPDGSLGDASWILDARQRGLIPLLIVQGVVMTDLARCADFVLAGASWVEKEASYTNGAGRLQGTAQVMPPPGEALEDWRILVDLGRALGVPLDYASAADIRADISTRYASSASFAGIASLELARPAPASHWLGGSNPSERWKWEVMFRDVPPVKGAVDPSSLPVPPGMIPLREVR